MAAVPSPAAARPEDLNADECHRPRHLSPPAPHRLFGSLPRRFRRGSHHGPSRRRRRGTVGARAGTAPLLGESYPSPLRDHQRRIRFRGCTQGPGDAHPSARSRRGRVTRRTRPVDGASTARLSPPSRAHPPPGKAPRAEGRVRARRGRHRPVPTGSVVPQVHRPPVSGRPDRRFVLRRPRLPCARRRAERSRPPNQCRHPVHLLRAHDRSRVLDR